MKTTTKKKQMAILRCVNYDAKRDVQRIPDADGKSRRRRNRTFPFPTYTVLDKKAFER